MRGRPESQVRDSLGVLHVRVRVGEPGVSRLRFGEPAGCALECFPGRGRGKHSHRVLRTSGVGGLEELLGRWVMLPVCHSEECLLCPFLFLPTGASGIAGCRARLGTEFPLGLQGRLLGTEMILEPPEVCLVGRGGNWSHGVEGMVPEMWPGKRGKERESGAGDGQSEEEEGGRRARRIARSLLSQLGMQAGHVSAVLSWPWGVRRWQQMAGTRKKGAAPSDVEVEQWRFKRRVLVWWKVPSNIQLLQGAPPVACLLFPVSWRALVSPC